MPHTVSLPSSTAHMVSSLFQVTYDSAPPWVRDLALSAYGFTLNRQRYTGDFEQLLEEASRNTFASSAEIRALHLLRWSERMAPAIAAVAAYGGRAIPLDRLPSLPVLSKHTLRAALGRFVRPDFPRGQVVRAHTSGTTGAGLQFLTTRHSLQRQWAYWWRYRAWHGLSRNEWCGVFGGRSVVPSDRTRPPFWQVNVPGRSLLFSQYHLTPERAPLYIAELRRRRLRWLHGYPSFIALLARSGIEAGLAGTTEVKWVTLGAENVLESQRAAICKMFGIAPRQHYGMAEGVASISECPLGRLHVDEDYAIVEFLPNCGAGGHRVIGTTLDNQVMPLVRYETGDVVQLPADTRACECGRPGRLVASIDGRHEDYLVLSDGTRVGRVDHLFKDAEHVVEAQILQSHPGEAVFRIVRSQRYSVHDEESLRREVASRFGDRLHVESEYVDSIPRTANGKLRLVVSTLAHARVG